MDDYDWTSIAPKLAPKLASKYTFEKQDFDR
jgi:hypothetical protein